MVLKIYDWFEPAVCIHVATWHADIH